MAFLGSACIFVALLVGIYVVGASLYGARTGRRELVVSARRGVYCLAGLLILAMIVLEAAYARSDFSFKLVAQNSSTVEQGERIFNIAALAVFISIIVHGLTDTAGANWIGDRAERGERLAGAAAGEPVRHHSPA